MKYNPIDNIFEVGGGSVGEETDPLSVHLDQTTPQTMTGIADGFLGLEDGVIKTVPISVQANTGILFVE
jgi:hypothetical protein